VAHGAPATAGPGPLALQRITTSFDAGEDRIRVCGEWAAGQTLVLWLTQRLLVRLVPHLLGWLEQQAVVVDGPGADVRAELVQGFAQQAAMASMEPQAPVEARAAQRVWLVQSVDVAATAQGVRLTFKAEDPAQAAGMTLQAQPLRQWLGVLHEQCRQAGWAAAPSSGLMWPTWVQSPAKPQHSVLH